MYIFILQIVEWGNEDDKGDSVSVPELYKVSKRFKLDEHRQS